ncbi:hypothetical protein EV175_000688, partial [Coemansia sp. RSA 1933]
MSIKSKEDLGKIPVRELRAYLQLYGLYKPSDMLEKSDLVAAIYNNSPMAQRYEEQYRRSLPQPSESSHPGHAENSQNQGGSSSIRNHHRRNDSDGRDSNGSWDRMFSNIGNEMGRAFENIGQQVGNSFERGANILDEHVSSVLDPTMQPNDAQRNSHGSVPAGGRASNYHSQTYSSPSATSQRQSHPRAQRSFYNEPQPFPRETPAQYANRSGSRETARATPATAASSAAQNTVPDIRSMVKDATDVSKLGIKMLKRILEKHHVDYSNIVEKKELVERVERLVRNTKLEMEREEAASESSADKSGNGGGGASNEDD